MKQIIEKAKREGVLATFEAAMNRLDQPLALGYSSAGTIIEVGEDLQNFKPGDRVVCAGGGHAVHAEYAVIPQNLLVHLPDEVAFESGAFATLGAIALNGIRLAKLQVGENVAVIGLGLLGLLTVQLVQAAGCQVVGIDLDPKRVSTGKKMGAKAILRKKAEQAYLSFTMGRGFDAVLICADTPSDDTVVLAGQIARDRAYVISVGVVGLNIPRKPYFEKELFFQVSRSSGPGRYDIAYEEESQDYPLGYVRWTEGRNLEAFVDLIVAGKVNVEQLITHSFPIEQAHQAYELITGKHDEPYLGILLTYASKQKKPKTQITYNQPQTQKTSGKLSIGVIGEGNYAKAKFLPVLKNAGGVRLAGIASSSGASAQHAAQRFNFAFSSSSAEDILKDKSIDIAVILTRHQDHAHLVLEGLEKKKHIYCEKPLAINEKELEKIERAVQKKNVPYLMVGFNRRFAPLAKELKSFLAGRTEPLYAHYRINAGYLPPHHWLHDPAQGGGRIIGEGCHFIDFLTFIVEESPRAISANALPDQGKYHHDNVHMLLEFPDGSIGTIAYLANGDKSYSKEYLEVFSGGSIALLNDFRSLELIENGHCKVRRTRPTQDKGHLAAWKAFLTAIQEKAAPPISYKELFAVSQATLAANKALLTGKKILLTN
jgi:predicted dehydrogenase/threonine dehydrogenase-like Zn-dependent dehydrogenase